jgi:hypothetical protein
MPTTERLRAALADRYAVEREIGSGGMATVYLARDLKHDREVALKVLRADLSAVIGAERFLSEVRITAKLDHPHILTLIDSGSADGLLYYVLPYVRGETLRARLTREKQLGIEDALSITKQVASALDYAHRQGVVHRDIKPENILFQEGEAVLADFGIALAVKEAGGNRLTETGLSLGTPQYMSPEQATGDRALDARSDIYSLGAVLYEMLTGEPPVTGATPQAVIAKLLTERPTSVRVVRDTVPPAVDLAVAKSLAKVPADRFASASDFMRALEIATTSAPTRDGRSLWRYAAAAGVVICAAGAWLAINAVRKPAPHVTLADRTQVTFTGRVRNPTISQDGTQLVYPVTNCGPAGCTYAIDVQDIGGTATRRLFEGATALYDVEWSADRRNILFEGSINGAFGQYLVSTLGGTPRRVTPHIATFWGNDSLAFIRTPHSNSNFWMYFSGLDGTPRDSVSIPSIGYSLQGMASVPGSKWIVVRFEEGDHGVWVSLDRSGREHGRAATPPVQNMLASHDALWMRFRSGASAQQPIVARMAFDATNGRISSAVDTLYRLGARDNDFSVTADGGTLMFSEGVAEFNVLTVDLRDGMKGALPSDRAVLHTTVAPVVMMSPDGGRLLLGRVDGSATGERRWSVMPAAGGAESPISGGGVGSIAFWTDSTTVAMKEPIAQGWRLSLVDIRTNAHRAALVVPDSVAEDFTPFPGGGWAWLGPGGRSIGVQPAGASTPRKLSLPAWYMRAVGLGASPDGSKLAIAGWSMPSADSIGLSVLSMADGAEIRWSTVFGEDAGFQWLADGSIMLYIEATNDTWALQHVRGPGQLDQLGAIPRPILSTTVSGDLRRMSVTTRDRHGDAWKMRVVKR